MFRGICFNAINGQPYKPVKLQNFLSVWDYVNLQKRLYPEVRIYSRNGTIIVKAIEGKVVKPGIWHFVERELTTQL
jgi:hypothetical protein